MASGLLVKAAVPAGVTRLPYSAPVDKVTTMNILVCNASPASVSAKIGIGTGNAIDAADIVQPTRTLAAGQVIERTGIAASPGEGVIVDASADGLVVRVHGFEEAR